MITFSLTTDEIVIYTVFCCFLVEGIQLNKISYTNSELIFSRTSKIKWLPNFFLGTWYPNYWSDVNVYCDVYALLSCLLRKKRLVKLSLYLQNIFELGRKKGTKGLMTRKIRNLVHIENDVIKFGRIWNFFLRSYPDYIISHFNLIN